MPAPLGLGSPLFERESIFITCMPFLDILVVAQFEEFFKETLLQFDAGAHAEGSVANIFRVNAL